MDISNIISKYSEKIADDKIFFAPDIPKKKLRNAITTYAQDANEADVLILVDNTAFGGAKDGMLITFQKIYLSNIFAEKYSLDLSELKTVKGKFGIIETRIDFNGGDCHLLLNVPEKKNFKIIFQMLEEICESKNSNFDNINVTEQAASVPKNCRSCGATNPPHIGACEYCETSLI